MEWGQFEDAHQLAFAPLLTNRGYKPILRATNSAHERMLRDLAIRVMRPTHYFEIGGYEAAASRAYAASRPEAVGIAFEPDPDIFRHFPRKHATKPIGNFTYENMAVSDSSGTLPFYKQTALPKPKANIELVASNSLLTGKKKEGYQYRAVDVRSVAIDSYVEGIDIGSALLRIDVEGMAYQVLKGARKTLEKTCAIYAEVEDIEVWDGQKTVFDIYELLDAHGFAPVSRDFQTHRQYNVLWLPKAVAREKRFRARIAKYYGDVHALNQQVLNLQVKEGQVPLVGAAALAAAIQAEASQRRPKVGTG